MKTPLRSVCCYTIAALMLTSCEKAALPAADPASESVTLTFQANFSDITRGTSISGFFTKLSAWLYKNYGSNGFSEMPAISFKLIFEAIF